MNSNKLKTLIIFLLPGIALVSFITLYPILNSLRISLYRMEYLNLVEYLGLRNFFTFLKDPITWKNIRASIIYVSSSVAISLPLGLALAIVLNQEIRFKALFRSIAIIPLILSQLVVALLWKWILDPVFGPINYLIGQIGINMKFNIGDPAWAMPILILANIWRTYPLAMVLILAALQAIPRELYESAKIDGTSGTQSFIFITIPMIIPTLIITLIQTTLGSFNMVTLIYMLTGGGPLGLTETLSLRVYREAFEYWNLHLSAVGGIIILLLNMIFSLLYIRFLRRESMY